MFFSEFLFCIKGGTIPDCGIGSRVKDGENVVCTSFQCLFKDC